MRDATQTRDVIVAQAASLFNRHGYTGVAISDVMKATGLQKGGIYNHFESKEDLALAAFEHALGRVRRRFIRALMGKRSAEERLKAILAVMQRYVADPPVEGGCPIQNTAIDSAEAHPALRARARQAMDELQEYLRQTVEHGMEQGELSPELHPDEVASVCMATLEGALMLSNLYEDPRHMDRAVAHLSQHIEQHLLR